MMLNRQCNRLSGCVSAPVVALLLVFGLLAGCSTPVGDDPVPTQSDRAQDFALADTTGEPWALSSALQDGPVVLLFLRGHW